MKKLLSFFFVGLLIFVLVACQPEEENPPILETEKEYVYNGTFTAFRESFNRGNPQLSWVSVTVEDGEIVSFYIDEVQTNASKSAENVYSWNSKTKKQLKEDYNMIVASPIGKEWYEQADFLEKYFLEHAPEFVEMDADGYPTNDDLITGTTMIVSTYVELALEAIANWKQGKYTALEYSMNNPTQFQFTWVDLKVEEGKVSEFYIDTIQSNRKTAENEFSWNKSKKVLKEDYNMIVASPIGREWFEQAETLEEYFLENPISDVLMDSEGYAQNVTGVSMKTPTYVKLAIRALNLFKEPTVIEK